MIDHHWFWFGRLHVGCPAHCQLRQQLWHKPGGVTWIHWEMNSYEKVHWEINTQLVDGLEHLDIFLFIRNNHPKWLIFFRGVETTNQPVIGMYPMKKCYVSQSLVCIPVIGFMVCKNPKKKQESMFSKGCFIQNLEFGISGMGWPYHMLVPWPWHIWVAMVEI